MHGLPSKVARRARNLLSKRDMVWAETLAGSRAFSPQFTSVFFGAAGGSGAILTPSSISALTSLGEASP